MARLFIIGGLLVAGVINLLPVAGVLGTPWLQTLYGIPIASFDLAILLQHRAILFGIVGTLLIAAIFLPALRVAAILAGGVSMGSFVAIAWAVGNYNALLSRIIVADVIGLIALAVALVGMRQLHRI